MVTDFNGREDTMYVVNWNITTRAHSVNVRGWKVVFFNITTCCTWVLYLFREWLYCIWQMTKIQAEEYHMLAYTIYSCHPIIRSTERWLPLLYFAKPTNSHTYYVDRSLTFEKFQYSILKYLSDSYASTYIACMHKVFFHGFNIHVRSVV